MDERAPGHASARDPGVALTRALRAFYPLQRVVFRGHDVLYRATRGRLGRTLAGRPCLHLTTTGRRSGRPRTVVLVFVRDGSRLVVVGSNAGTHAVPAWCQNLEANPVAVVSIDGVETIVRASVLPGDERDRLWPAVDRANYRQYGRYQALVDRSIPLVALEPVGPGWRR